MSKKTTCVGVRPQLIGDSIFVLPVLNYWKKLYGDIDVTWVVAKKCSQAAPFFQNHPLINNIIVSDDDEGNIYTINGKTYDQRYDDLPFDVRTPNFNPPEPYNHTYNNYNAIERAWIMAGLELSDYYNLPKEEQRPRLYAPPYAVSESHISPRVITIFPFAGYNKSSESKRSPSPGWWKEMVEILIKNKYIIQHCGHPSEPILSDSERYFNFTSKTLYNQVIDYAIQSAIVIGTDSGSSWLVGAYNRSSPLINLLTYSFAGHYKNPYGLAPMHYGGKQTNLFCPSSCDGISHEYVFDAVKNSN